MVFRHTDHTGPCAKEATVMPGLLYQKDCDRLPFRTPPNNIHSNDHGCSEGLRRASNSTESSCIPEEGRIHSICCHDHTSRCNPHRREALRIPEESGTRAST